MIWEPVLAKFKELFGDEGEIGVYFAPGRVNMIGEHTDYNGGHVFPCALTIGTYGVARKRDDKKLRFYSMNFENLGVLESSVAVSYTHLDVYKRQLQRSGCWKTVRCGRPRLLSGRPEGTMHPCGS